MKNYLEIMDKVDHEHVTTEMWECVAEHTNKYIEEMRNYNPHKTEEFLEDLEDALLYPPYTKEEAEQLVAGFQNKDGSRGQHWSMAQVKEVAKAHPELMEHSCEEVYITMNMIYSDYYSTNFDLDDYICLAKGFLQDKDAPHNKVRRYFMAMHS